MKPPNFWVGYPNPWASILFHYDIKKKEWSAGRFLLELVPSQSLNWAPTALSFKFVLGKKRWSGQFWGFGFKWCFRKFEVQCPNCGLNICFVRLVFSSFGVVSHKFWFQLLPSKSLGLIPNNYILRIEISKKRTARKPCKMQAPMTTCPSFEINSPYFRSFGKELTLIACRRTVHVGVAVIRNYANTARTHKLPQTAGIWIFKC